MSSIPLWQQLHADLVRRIESGEFPDRFPGEIELVESYAVSRHTVREAVGRLRREGVIRSSRGRSSVVTPGVIAQDMGVMYSLFHELESRGMEQHSEVRSLDRRANSGVAERLGLSEHPDLIYIERLRYADETPMAWECVWLAPDLAAGLLEADLSHAALYDEWYRVSGVRLTGGREAIRAVVPSETQRDLLLMDADEGGLLVERMGHFGDRAVEYRRTLVRGSRFSLTTEWSRVDHKT